MVAQASLDAHALLPGKPLRDSTAVGWRSVLLRSYLEPPEVEELSVPATPDHHIVLVTAGSCDIESRRGKCWHRAQYGVGDLGMTSPGEETRLRWRSARPHQSLHLYVPSDLLETARQELGAGVTSPADLPNRLRQNDPLITAVMTALECAVEAGAPELYAQSSAYFLAAHLLTSRAQEVRPSRPSGATALQRVDEYMRANLASPLTLNQLALIAGLGPFQFLRAAKAVWNETPMRRLTRRRMELAQRLLKSGECSVGEVALSCGYSNPSHFATAFRRSIGVAPTVFQRLH